MGVTPNCRRGAVGRGHGLAVALLFGVCGCGEVRVVLSRAPMHTAIEYQSDQTRYAGTVAEPLCARSRGTTAARPAMGACFQTGDGLRVELRTGLRRGAAGRSVTTSEVAARLREIAPALRVTENPDSTLDISGRPAAVLAAMFAEQPVYWVVEGVIEGTGPFFVTSPSDEALEVARLIGVPSKELVALRRRETRWFGVNDVVFYSPPEDAATLVPRLHHQQIHVCQGFGPAERDRLTGAAARPEAWRIEPLPPTTLAAAVGAGLAPECDRAAVATALRAVACDPAWLRKHQLRPAHQALHPTTFTLDVRRCPEMPEPAPACGFDIVSNSGWGEYATSFAGALAAAGWSARPVALPPPEEKARRIGEPIQVSMLGLSGDDENLIPSTIQLFRDLRWIATEDGAELEARPDAAKADFREVPEEARQAFSGWLRAHPELVPLATVESFTARNTRLSGFEHAYLVDVDALWLAPRSEWGYLVLVVLGVLVGLSTSMVQGRRIRRLDAARALLSGQLRAASHEWKSPLSSLRQSIRTAEGMDRHERVRLLRDLDFFYRTLQRFRAFADAFGRAPAPEPVLRLRVDIVEPLITSMRQRAAELEEDVRIALSGVEHGDARVSATVEQALRTLLDNAHAYAGEGGASIRVRLAPAGPLRVAIEVEDDGIGIEAELSEKDLFANGRRGKRAKDHRPQGLGIGLFVTRQLLEGIGGTIRLVHREKPTVFRIEVPCKGGRRKP